LLSFIKKIIVQISHSHTIELKEEEKKNLHCGNGILQKVDLQKKKKKKKKKRELQTLA
jgi:hypothetical protein